jgi:hypothetical protein
MKNYNDTAWNRTRDLPACRSVSQTTAPPHGPLFNIKTSKYVCIHVESSVIITRDPVGIRTKYLPNTIPLVLLQTVRLLSVDQRITWAGCQNIVINKRKLALLHGTWALFLFHTALWRLLSTLLLRKCNYLSFRNLQRERRRRKR